MLLLPVLLLLLLQLLLMLPGYAVRLQQLVKSPRAVGKLLGPHVFGGTTHVLQQAGFKESLFENAACRPSCTDPNVHEQT